MSVFIAKSFLNGAAELNVSSLFGSLIAANYTVTLLVIISLWKLNLGYIIRSINVSFFPHSYNKIYCINLIG